MMKRLLSVPGILLLATAARAQEYGPTGGDNLLSVAGSIATYSVDSFTVFSLTGYFSFGRFLTDEHEVGASLVTSYIDPEDGDEAIAEGLAAYYNYNWRSNPRTWFYAGPHLGLSIFDAGGDDETTLTIGGHGGLRHWLTPATAFFAEPRLTVGSDLFVTELVFGYTITL